MCGIAGYCAMDENLLYTKLKQERLVENMGKKLLHRGPDDFGIYVGEHVAFSHSRLAVMDPPRGKQPMKKSMGMENYYIVYNGEVYNARELRKELEKKGISFVTDSDTEVVLATYMVYGKKMVEKLNGIYSFVIWKEREQSLFFCRDRLGVKPLFYTMFQGKFFFASEIKALFAYPGIRPKISSYGISQIMGIGPARIPGSGVYEGIYEVLPAHCGIYSQGGLQQWCYWQPCAKECKESYEDAVEHVKEILTDAIERQLISDVPICTLLSGGLDSSVVSAVAAKYMRDRGKALDTYSFDYSNNSKNFKASSFQPEEDRPYVDKMVAHIGSNHQYLECNEKELFHCLLEAVKAKDMPGMTDVDASLLYFSKQIKKKHTVCLSGECADEIFGGYPWFRAKESFQVDRFPWSRDLEFRQRVLRPEVRKKLQLDSYVQGQYIRSVEEASCLSEENIERASIFVEHPSSIAMKRREREIAWLNIRWFMATLLERKDRMTMACGLEVRVPFADHRLVGYLYSLPWDYKYHKGQVKSLLKDAMGEYLPASVIERKKCPYPKTYDPKFEQLLKTHLMQIFDNKNAPIHDLVDVPYVKKLMRSPSDYGKPWFGQLMALPQMYAYLIQTNLWLEEYAIEYHF